MKNEPLIFALEFTDYINLKKCPFCGSKWEGVLPGITSTRMRGLYVYDNAPSSDIKPWAHVVCLDCGAGQNSIAKWNSRVCTQ